VSEPVTVRPTRRDARRVAVGVCDRDLHWYVIVGGVVNNATAATFADPHAKGPRPGRGGPAVTFGDAALAGDPVLEATVRGIVERVEVLLRESVEAADPVLNESARHLVEAGGKRFRPLLTALVAQLGGTSTSEEVVLAGAVVELTHLATLYHDDVMDEAPVRRGAPSANARWGNAVAILTGDYLFARAANLAARLGPEAVRIQADTFARLVQGQIAETVGPRGVDPVEHYLRVIADKTGSLIGTCARFGGMFGGLDPSTVEVASAYGETVGIAFQLSDDLLDISSPATESGKTPGTDLREGVPTLPVLYALADDATDPNSLRLREILALGPLTDDDLVAEALELLRESSGLKRARETVRGYAERARNHLAELPDGSARRALESLADVIADRTA
jgi:heptaprenyl diphosphate synthase